ncbi:uncharacterized protein [Nicotiana tomentosiformis]|uniref:uncharacterized protein n=1 Tax=Nicotiana tomentosiformis TaxID=4098 RepID=UPI00388CB14B
MSIILENTLNRLISSSPNTTTFTIFCPTEKAFLNIFPKYPGPPYRLIQYQVVPLKLNKENLEFSRHKNSNKLKTLLPGHHIIITTLSHDENVSINDVNVVEWDVYNNGCVIVYGVDEFFDPALKILVYPNRDIDSSSNVEKSIEKKKYGFKFEDYVEYWFKNPEYIFQLTLLLMEVGVAIVFICYIMHYCILENEDYIDDDVEVVKVVTSDKEKEDVKLPLFRPLFD